MINLRIHTEFHFSYSDRGYGRVANVVQRIKSLGQAAACITDASTYGHVPWFTECKAAGIKPLLGVELRLDNMKFTLIARDGAGLKELYHYASEGENLTLGTIHKSSPHVIKLLGSLPPPKGKAATSHWYADISPTTPPALRAVRLSGSLPVVAVAENRYPAPEDRSAFSLFGGSVETHPQHLMSERELRVELKGLPESAFTLSDRIAEQCNVSLPKAVNMTVKGDIEKLCRANIKARLGRWTKRYEERLKFEIEMIRSKNFESYFLIISDMCIFAKKHMVTGPARGSSAGSLVCFLLYITDIDPIAHGLMFERFIDVTRNDLPDIDLDFPPDEKRQMVIEHLRQRYGEANVAHIGTIMTLQPRSIIRLVGKKLGISPWEFQPLLDVMIERASGDSRGELCLLDTIEGMDAGRAMLSKVPALRSACAFEGHANGSGTHAAGIIVCAEPIESYCTVADGTAQIDKITAEKINLLKIDVLGLRTLSVFEHTLSLLKKPPVLTEIPLDDPEAFAVFNDQRWAGIFQFEGDALQMLQKTITVSRFSDIVAITALGRPGPLNSGGGQEWCDRRMGREGRMADLHPLCSEFVEETHGIIIFQEQVMQIARKVGQLDWNDVQDIRKTMSKTKGEEAFNKYWDKFYAGSKAQGVSLDAAKHIWGSLSTMGAWAFNKSHAVAYALISYWCAWLKAHHPLEFAAATLRHTKNEEQTIEVLRELLDGGGQFTAFDPERSGVNWEVMDGRLVGGFLNLKGIGEVTAKSLIATRAKGWTQKQREKVEGAEVLYSNLYPARDRYGAMYKNPAACGLPAVRKLYTLRELDDLKANQSKDLPSEFFFLGRLADKVPRDLNEYGFQVSRTQEGKPRLLTEFSAYANLVMEDDTGKIGMTVNRYVYPEVGKPIVETGVTGKSWYVMRGKFNQLRRINITWAKDISNQSYPLEQKG